jgi:hypothetical protein
VNVTLCARLESQFKFSPSEKKISQKKITLQVVVNVTLCARLEGDLKEFKTTVTFSPLTLAIVDDSKFRP